MQNICQWLQAAILLINVLVLQNVVLKTMEVVFSIMQNISFIHGLLDYIGDFATHFKSMHM